LKNFLLVSLILLAEPAWAFTDCSDCPEMIDIPAGSFLMGSPSNKNSSSRKKLDDPDDEKPQHKVKIKEFSLGKFEVTQAQWHALMDSNPSHNKGPTLPIENISWDDAHKYIQKLNQKTGKKYRLPSEAEWEYAARGGSTSSYPWGDNVSELTLHAWSKANAVNTNIVGLKKPNSFGLYDMIGNVSEWTQDCWNDNYRGAPRDGSPWPTGNCSLRVLRGGSWGDDPQQLRTAMRDGTHPNYYRFSGSSFRVARDK
jgi:formylglycine-generating enzyme required for sulfatase activity